MQSKACGEIISSFCNAIFILFQQHLADAKNNIYVDLYCTTNIWWENI